jgi:integrase
MSSAALVARAAQLGELKRPVHTLRHTNARLRRETGASIEEVQAALDHSSLATTAIYLRKLEGTSDVHGARIAALLQRGADDSPAVAANNVTEVQITQ